MLGQLHDLLYDFLGLESTKFAQVSFQTVLVCLAPFLAHCQLLPAKSALSRLLESFLLFERRHPVQAQVRKVFFLNGIYLTLELLDPLRGIDGVYLLLFEISWT